MGYKKIIVQKQVANSIAGIAWYIESKGILKTADIFCDAVYDYIFELGNENRSYPFCRESKRKMAGLKCAQFKKKYTIAFKEYEIKIIIVEFIPSKLIY